MAGQKRSLIAESQALRAAPGLRMRHGDYIGVRYSLPENGRLYSANEAVKKSMMFRILKEYRETSNVSWKVRGRTPQRLRRIIYLPCLFLAIIAATHYMIGPPWYILSTDGTTLQLMLLVTLQTFGSLSMVYLRKSYPDYCVRREYL